MSKTSILITGSAGQLGIELAARLRQEYGEERVIATDIRKSNRIEEAGPFEHLDVLDREHLADTVARYEIGTIYHLAAILSANGEKQIEKTWELNIDGLLNVLELGRSDGNNPNGSNKPVSHIFWPSSIAVFGPDASREMTPQNSPLNPTTVYGISKVAGEQWCAYYHHRFGVDVRSLRYPGLIGYKSEPGGGTTDYAVDMLQAAASGNSYTCPLGANTRLPMMYMDDAVKASRDLMSAPSEVVDIRTSYNVGAMSFSPDDMARVIRRHVPGFDVDYAPDERDTIAASWPDSIDDGKARQDWEWKPDFDLGAMVKYILDKYQQAV